MLDLPEWCIQDRPIGLIDRDLGDRLGITALASFPGTGSVWLRYLLQQSTGFLTGSHGVRNVFHLANGFPAEGSMNSSVVVVSSGNVVVDFMGYFHKAVLLVRDSLSSIETNYRLSYPSSSSSSLNCPSQQEKAEFLEERLHSWKTFYSVWASEFSGPLLVVRYGSLVKNTELELKRIINFIGLDPPSQSMLRCTLSRLTGGKLFHVRKISGYRGKSIFDSKCDNYSNSSLLFQSHWLDKIEAENRRMMDRLRERAKYEYK